MKPQTIEIVIYDVEDEEHVLDITRAEAKGVIEALIQHL